MFNFIFCLLFLLLSTCERPWLLALITPVCFSAALTRSRSRDKTWRRSWQTGENTNSRVPGLSSSKPDTNNKYLCCMKANLSLILNEFWKFRAHLGIAALYEQGLERKAWISSSSSSSPGGRAPRRWWTAPSGAGWGSASTRARAGAADPGLR